MANDTSDSDVYPIRFFELYTKVRNIREDYDEKLNLMRSVMALLSPLNLRGTLTNTMRRALDDANEIDEFLANQIIDDHPESELTVYLSSRTFEKIFYCQHRFLEECWRPFVAAYKALLVKIIKREERRHLAIITRLGEVGITAEDISNEVADALVAMNLFVNATNEYGEYPDPNSFVELLREVTRHNMNLRTRLAEENRRILRMMPSRIPDTISVRQNRPIIRRCPVMGSRIPVFRDGRFRAPLPAPRPRISRLRPPPGSRVPVWRDGAFRTPLNSNSPVVRRRISPITSSIRISNSSPNKRRATIRRATSSPVATNLNGSFVAPISPVLSELNASISTNLNETYVIIRSPTIVNQSYDELRVSIVPNLSETYVIEDTDETYVSVGILDRAFNPDRHGIRVIPRAPGNELVNYPRADIGVYARSLRNWRTERENF